MQRIFWGVGFYVETRKGARYGPPFYVMVYPVESPEKSPLVASPGFPGSVWAHGVVEHRQCALDLGS